jgi:hypothetical protein
MNVRSMLLVAAYGVIPLATSSTALPTQYLTIWGGGGGTGFTRSCGDGRVLTGLQYRVGLVVDAVGVLCRPVQANGTLGSQTTVGSLAGGTNGTPNNQSCPTGQVVVGAALVIGSFVDGIHLRCHAWSASGRSFGSTTLKNLYIGLDGPRPGGNIRGNSCEANTQPAVGIRGRASSVVDAMGFFCDEP